MAEQRKGTPILMRFLNDAFAAHLRTVEVNYVLHQYKLSIAPSGESDTELLENVIRTIGNAKPAVQNSLMSAQRILGEPNLPQQMMDDFDLHVQWCQSTMEELELCDATIRNAILSKDDYLSILSQALSPYYEAMGIQEEFGYPEGDEVEETPDDDTEDVPEDTEEGTDDDTDPPLIMGIDPYDTAYEGSGATDTSQDRTDIESMKAELAEFRELIGTLRAQRNLQDTVSQDDDAFSGPFRTEAPERTLTGTSGVVDEVYELTGDGLHTVSFPEDVVQQAEEGPVVTRPALRPIGGSGRMPSLRPRGVAIRQEPPVVGVSEPRELIEEVAEPVIVSPGSEHTATESDYEGLFGYDQYDEPDNPQPLAEDPIRLAEIAEKASEVIAATRRKVGRTATKSKTTSAKGKGKTAAKTGQRKTATKTTSKSTGRTTRPRKKATDTPVTTDTDSGSVEQTTSETASQFDNEKEDTQ